MRYIINETMYINKYYQTPQSFGLDYALKHYHEWTYIQGIKNDKKEMYLALFYVGNNSETLNQILQYRKRTKQN